ncbi:MAG TPA: DASS family sodium-coupled anion symporter [Phycisphaerales bacterium]|nr:DASS family sodium-coupled anion symporter [Phycisphaerales bacterium]
MTTDTTGTWVIVKRAGLVSGPVLGAAAWGVLARTQLGEGLSGAGCATVALMTWMAVWWVTEAVDLAVTSLLPLAVLPLTGAASMKATCVPYAAETIFLFMGGFLLALSMQRWGLDRRIAIVTLRLVGTRARAIVAGFMLVTGVISAFVSNTATAAMMLPVGLGVIGLVRHGSRPSVGVGADRDGRNFATCLMLGIAYASSIGGVATLVGTPPNVVLGGFMKDALGQELPFAKFLLVGVPLAVLFLPVAWFVLTYVVFPVRMGRIAHADDLLESQRRELGPVKFGEWATMCAFGVAVVLWMTLPVLKTWEVGSSGTAWKPFGALTDAGVAMTCALVLFVIPVPRQRGTMVMDWETAQQLPWGILILFGGGLSLADAIEKNGVAEFIGRQSMALHGMPTVVLVAAVVAGLVFFSELASNTASAAAMVPILAGVAKGIGLKETDLIVPAALAASCAFMLPVGTPPNAMVFATGHVRMSQMCKAGLVLNLVGIVLITALTMVWYRVYVF